MELYDKNIGIFESNNGEILFNHIADRQNENTQKPHFHDFCELFLYISGDVGYYNEGNHYNLEYGDLVTVRPNEIHAPIIKKLCEYERFYIKFPLISFERLRRDIASPIGFITDPAPSAGSLIKLPEINMREVVACFYKISSLIQSGTPGWQVMSYSYMLRILAIIGACVENKVCIDTPSILPPPLDKILSCINSEYSHLGSAKELAERFGISNSYLSRLFAKYMGISYNQYLNAKRISHAKTLLGNGASVTEACYECGFCDCSYFISVFKSNVGTTPYQYKKSGGSYRTNGGTFNIGI